MMRVGLAFVTVLIVAALARPAGARKWVDATGDHSVEAELADFRDGVVRLKTDDGRTISLPLARLSEADQEYVRHLSIDEPVCEQPSEARAAESGSAESSGKESAPAEPATDVPDHAAPVDEQQSIPDVGGGFSGFLAHGLWHVYQYFPFEGTWDWLLLIIFLAVLARCIMIPVWWRLLDVAKDHEGVTAIVILGDWFWPWVVIWLFNTAAGRTFLEGGSGQPLDVAGEAMYRFSFVYHVAAFVVGSNLIDQDDLDSFRSNMGGTVVAHSTVALVAHLFYWYWSVASLAVFGVFSITAVVTGATVAWLKYVHDGRLARQIQTGGNDHGEAEAQHQAADRPAVVPLGATDPTEAG